jgi:DNA-binding protein HU-beta
MTKDQMIEGIMRASGISKANVERFYDGLVVLTEKELQNKGEFVLPGLGAFKVRVRKARIARNPKTGEPVKVPSKKVVRFTPYATLKTLFGKKEGPKGVGEGEEGGEGKEGLL